MNDKIQLYNNKKELLEQQLETLNKDIILNDQSIKQQEELFMKTFNTTDIAQLNNIKEQYLNNIQQLEQQLIELENNINQEGIINE